MLINQPGLKILLLVVQPVVSIMTVLDLFADALDLPVLLFDLLLEGLKVLFVLLLSVVSRHRISRPLSSSSFSERTAALWSLKNIVGQLLGPSSFYDLESESPDVNVFSQPLARWLWDSL